MRHEHYRMSEAEAVRLLSAVPVVHVAAVSPEGRPLLRTVHGVVFDGALYFHGAPKGEKSEMAGWPAVVSAEEVVASV
ncbi:pyridoxamine 5'-phosphate oxidase family protein, partial [Myxococcota bacterium]|nr:pyridoxamine 5'-phosphate oxidase family protein [Myxococcota bacterium]